ncbi:alpha-ketoglutarate dehydrogenase component 4-like [Apodemus sylvaticus]|uniref:alpha-ketoglutarate dehydrogenase component 4-like n=1 Tax=Apodemus sylvaticus TaxID=10129 RepID=UPI00224425CA|nr:alpha-ketoglutarate dehydrogenase component 4-like [Apodemus sylvaticus]
MQSPSQLRNTLFCTRAPPSPAAGSGGSQQRYTLGGVWRPDTNMQIPTSQQYHESLYRGKMASASRVVQGVKPPAPSIRVSNRRDGPGLERRLSEALGSTATPSLSSVNSQHSKGSPSPGFLMHQGPPDTADRIKTLSRKHRRKPMSQEKMEFTQRGSPE